MFCIIGFLIIYVFILFIIVLGIFGFEGNIGLLELFYNWCRRKIGYFVLEEIFCEDIFDVEY